MSPGCPGCSRMSPEQSFTQDHGQPSKNQQFLTPKLSGLQTLLWIGPFAHFVSYFQETFTDFLCHTIAIIASLS